MPISLFDTARIHIYRNLAIQPCSHSKLRRKHWQSSNPVRGSMIARQVRLQQQKL